MILSHKCTVCHPRSVYTASSLVLNRMCWMSLIDWHLCWSQMLFVSTEHSKHLTFKPINPKNYRFPKWSVRSPRGSRGFSGGFRGKLQLIWGLWKIHRDRQGSIKKVKSGSILIIMKIKIDQRMRYQFMLEDTNCLSRMFKILKFFNEKRILRLALCTISSF